MKCFVIMPYGNLLTDPSQRQELDVLYQLIKSAVESIRLRGQPDLQISCHRGDKQPRPGEIVAHIVENLVEAEIAIADLSGRNANVFYELGVRHAVNDNTVLLARNEEDVPFDLRGQRLIIYRLDFEGGVRLRSALVEAIEDIIQAPRKIDNPVRRHIFEREKEKIQVRGTPPGYDVIKELLAEVANLRKEFAEQLTEVRRIMHAVTSSETLSRIDNDFHCSLRAFEGVWRISPSNSLLVARVIKGELVAPYSYGGRTDLTGRYYNFRLIGTNLFARFQWLADPSITGYGFVEIRSVNQLVGGWWYAGDLPCEVDRDITLIHKDLPWMNESTWERVQLDELPAWAEEYFAEVEARS